MEIILVVGVIAAVVGYFFWQHNKGKAQRDTVAADNAEADRKNALYLQYCKDNNIQPYVDVAAWQAFLATA